MFHVFLCVGSLVEAQIIGTSTPIPCLDNVAKQRVTTRDPCPHKKWTTHWSHGSSAISWLHKMQRRSHFEESFPYLFHYMCAHNRLSFLKHMSGVVTNQICDHLPYSSIHLIYNEQCDNDEVIIILFLIVTHCSKNVGGPH
jgi:hypothetical protein